MNIHLVSTSSRPSSRGHALLLDIERAVRERGATTGFTDMRALPAVLCDGRESAQYPVEYRILRQCLETSDVVVLAVPIHQYAVAGGAKNLVEIVGGSLKGKLVAVVSAAGSPRSHLATATLLPSMIFDLGCVVFPGTLQSSAGAECDPERIERFAIDLLALASRLTANNAAHGESEHGLARMSASV